MVDRAKKEQSVTEMKEAFENATTVIVSNFNSLTMDESNELRSAAKESGATVRVAKNTLAKIASKDTNHSNVVDLFSGQTLISYSEDPVAAAKVIADFAKKNEKITIIGGSYEGNQIDDAGVKELANTPSLDESRGKIVGLLNAPAGKIARIFGAPAGDLARVLNAYSQKDEK